ncbi:putative F-box domain, galactose oxidase/kelch, beta-propeller, F-box associated interaction [Medicago truncatula]|uniref:F-box protein interaction domain protein n=1 Tax=Medicago truncatula TaxID=3880 RepID=G7JKX2_MEDTR|nr:F-box/kelch-repeat protein At3g23880-like [Medicago truncatula]AES88432.1 F-box protein interaction domain protein [Medicago truncatula]RHN60549.1 putative F-box domain, galactose oxidase/kelch, beta-propeller, F-box associated interaction [Medicago truncatula]
MEETYAAMNKQLTLISPPSFSSDDDSLPILPFDLIEEILCRLPVKLLLQLRCVCNSWNSLISHPKFSKKHLRMSTTCRIHRIRRNHGRSKFLLKSYTLHSVFTDDVTTDVMHLSFPSTSFYLPSIVASCNGILCIADLYQTSSIHVLLWNPSIRKFKELPLLEKAIGHVINLTSGFGFGYDSSTDNYKVVVVLGYTVLDNNLNYVNKTDMMVHTLGTNFWKSIQECPFGDVCTKQYVIFVSGTINWLTSIDKYRQSALFIVSFDLEKEFCRKVLPPDDEGVDVSNLTLGVLRDFLCIISGNDVWVMKEYGIQESWTKLFTLSNMQDPSKSYMLFKVLYTFEDDKVLLQCIGNGKWILVVYDLINGTFKLTKFECNFLEVCVESLISPCF